MKRFNKRGIYMNDNELLILLRSDPERGLAQTVTLYGGYVYKIAFAKLSDVCTKEDIEEIAGDIFFMFYNICKKENFEMRSVKAMLSVIAKRHCIDIFRRQSKQDQMTDYDDLENVISDDNDIGGNAYLLEAIHKLGEPDSSIFVRKYYFGQKNTDIAKELGMKESTLNMRLSRGLKKLKKLLEEES